MRQPKASQPPQCVREQVCGWGNSTGICRHVQPIQRQSTRGPRKQTAASTAGGGKGRCTSSMQGVKMNAGTECAFTSSGPDTGHHYKHLHAPHGVSHARGEPCKGRAMQGVRHAWGEPCTSCMTDSLNRKCATGCGSPKGRQPLDAPHILAGAGSVL